MDDRLASLSPGQAEEVLQEFYHLLPAELFAGGKPTHIDLADLTDRAREEATGEVGSFIEAVVDSPDAARRGEVARIILDRCHESPGLRAYVEEAMRRAAVPHMALPLVYPAYILALAAIPSKIEFNEDGSLKSIEWDQLDKAANFVNALTGFVKALPTGVWSWLTGGSGTGPRPS